MWRRSERRTSERKVWTFPVQRHEAAALGDVHVSVHVCACSLISIWRCSRARLIKLDPSDLSGSQFWSVRLDSAPRARCRHAATLIIRRFLRSRSVQVFVLKPFVGWKNKKGMLACTAFTSTCDNHHVLKWALPVVWTSWIQKKICSQSTRRPHLSKTAGSTAALIAADPLHT